MADFTAGPEGAGVTIPTGKYVNIAAAAVSVTLIVGVGVWGYKLLMRDVTGVPVVRAMVGDMRVAPENPGGEIASNIGLSVNSVPAEGGAAAPEDRLVLAPSNVGLAAEDLVVNQSAEEDEVAAEPVELDIAAQPIPINLNGNNAEPATEVDAASTPLIDTSTPLTADEVLALADQIAAGTTPLTDLADGEAVPIEVAVNGVAVNPDIVPDGVPGVRLSPRPTVRPAALRIPAPAAEAPQATAAAPAEAAPTAVRGEVTTAALPAGTNLVQLGAFDSADIAASEWQRLNGRFPQFFNGKEQIIQEATSSGRTFYRLRAMGFSDLSDARRFCAAMTAEEAACIPVVVR